ncbi:type II toxin-antitoxin system VapC family toxin [Methanoregula sp.]|uniref:type II toxin-antitoxin system VapC family toxin n=1 Tax=Methanoregula sp. TaxID=2052170 RepID=UPI003563927F
MPIADTSFIVDLMRKDPGALACYRAYEEDGIVLFTTGITALELYKGAFVSKNDSNRIKVQTILELFIVLPVDESVYEAFGRIAAGLCLSGNPIGDFDEVIAALALCNDKEIITRDRHFEKIPNLSVISY